MIMNTTKKIMICLGILGIIIALYTIFILPLGYFDKLVETTIFIVIGLLLSSYLISSAISKIIEINLKKNNKFYVLSLKNISETVKFKALKISLYICIILAIWLLITTDFYWIINSIIALLIISVTESKIRNTLEQLMRTIMTPEERKLYYQNKAEHLKTQRLEMEEREIIRIEQEKIRKEEEEKAKIREKEAERELPD